MAAAWLTGRAWEQLSHACSCPEWTEPGDLDAQMCDLLRSSSVEDQTRGLHT